MCRSKVVFPLPLPPRIAKISPRSTWKSMFSSSTTPSKPSATPDTLRCGSDVPGIEHHGERRVDDDQREEHRHHRGGRGAANAPAPAAGAEAELEADTGCRLPDSKEWHNALPDLPERQARWTATWVP